MKTPRPGLVLIFALSALAAWPARGETPPPDGATPEPKEPGYTVAVEFDVDSAGSVTNAKIVRSEVPVLNDFALSAVLAGRVNPQPLPAPGSESKHVSTDLFFPVEAYDSGKPLPAGVVLPRPIFQPSPAYPFEYRRKKITGGVWLSETVDTSGTWSPRARPSARPTRNLAPWRSRRFSAGSSSPPPSMAIARRSDGSTSRSSRLFQIGGESHGWKWLVAPQPSLDSFAVTTNVD